MSDIDELQRRITAAMDRVAKGLEQVGPAAPDPEPLRLLEEERTVSAQLTERVRALREKADQDKAALEAKLASAEARMSQLDMALQRVRRANAQLTESCAALQSANAEGVGDPHLINKAMQSELEGLRAARAAEVSEASGILDALMPLLDTPAAPATPDQPETA